MTGELAAARLHFEKALALYRDAGAESAALARLGGLADITWALGDLDAALAAALETVALLRNSPLARKCSFGSASSTSRVCAPSVGSSTKRSRRAREGLPLLQEAGYAWNVLDHLALRAALAGKLANAARIAGYADSMRGKKVDAPAQRSACP